MSSKRVGAALRLAVAGLLLGGVVHFFLASNQSGAHLLASPPGTARSLDIREWPVPWEATRPRDPAVGVDGTIWFVGQVGNYVARLNPKTGAFQRYELPEGTMPHNVIVDGEGIPWFSGNRAGYIGRLDPESGEVDRYELPDGVRDPHTLERASDGSIWFTAQWSGYVGRLFPGDGTVDVIDVPGENTRPYGIVVDQKDRPWIAFMGDNAIGTVDPASMELRKIETPTEGSRIRRLDVSSDGRIWWVDYGRGHVGVYDPENGSMSQWRCPGGEDAGPYGMAVDHRDRVWFVETRLDPNRIVGFEPGTEQFVSINEIPSGGGSVRYMVHDADERALWFGTDTNNIGRALLPD